MYLSSEVNTGFNGIANQLTDNRVPTRSGKPWTATQVKNILTNDVYIGKIHWQQFPEHKKSVNGSIIKYRTYNPNCHIFDGLHQPLIDDITYNRVQNIINSRKSPLTLQRPMQNPFAGVLVCGLCGKPLKRRPIDARRPGHAPSFDCVTRGCPTVSSPTDIVERKILAGIREWLSNYKIELKNVKQPEVISNSHQIQAANNKLSELQQQLGRTYTLLEQGIYDKDTFLSRQNFLKEQIKDVVDRIAQLENEDKLAKTRAEYNNTLIPQLENLLEVYDSLPNAKAKNDLIKKIFYQIRYTKSEPGNRWKPDAVDNFQLEFISRLPKQ